MLKSHTLLQYVLVSESYGPEHNYARISRTQVRNNWRIVGSYVISSKLGFMEVSNKMILLSAENGCWPSLKTLSLLRLWSMIFPCSDFRHVVMTPALLLMCEYLMRCPIMSGRDIAIGSFLCSMVLSVCILRSNFPLI